MELPVDPRPDEPLDGILAYVLQAGVFVSATVIACGGLVFLAFQGFERPVYDVFEAEPNALRSVQGILADAMQLHGRGLIQLGLLLLIATPIGRVVFSVLGFARERDWLYVAITLVVLALLLYSLIGG